MTTIPTPKGELQRHLGERFRAVRTQRGVWLRDLAAALRCSINTIRWHENGARMFRADTLVLAAQHMNVSPSLLIGEGEFNLEKDEQNGS